MADKAKLAEQQARGSQAENILKNPLVVAAFEAIQGEIEDGWKNTTAEEDEQRQNAYLMWRLFGKFKTHFESHIRTGEFATKELLTLKDEEKDAA